MYVQSVTLMDTHPLYGSKGLRHKSICYTEEVGSVN